MIELDNIDTWGDNIKEKIIYLNKLEEENEEKRMNEISKYTERKEKIINHIIEELDQRKIACYHCTRLTKDEYYSVKEKGLVVLTKEGQVERIKKLNLEENYKNQLIENIKVEDLSSRENQIHFIYSLKSIDFGCIPFLENWGGESIGYNVNKFESIREKIIDISKPYIIKFAIKYSDMCAGFFIENMKKRLKYGKIYRRSPYK